MALELNGTTGVSEVQAGIVTDEKLALSANSAEVKEALNATGSAPVYACRAWVNFDGNTTSIRESGNVSSVTDSGTGRYTVNFTTSMPDNNYAASFALGPINTSSSQVTIAGEENKRFATDIGVIIQVQDGGAQTDRAEVYVAIFR